LYDYIVSIDDTLCLQEGTFVLVHNLVKL